MVESVGVESTDTEGQLYRVGGYEDCHYYLLEQDHILYTLLHLPILKYHCMVEILPSQIACIQLFF